jgi:hypothetical protein
MIAAVASVGMNMTPDCLTGEKSHRRAKITLGLLGKVAGDWTDMWLDQNEAGLQQMSHACRVAYGPHDGLSIGQARRSDGSMFVLWCYVNNEEVMQGRRNSICRYVHGGIA